MTDPKVTLLNLKKNLNILREREAKYAGNAPLDLLNQIDDHRQAIDLTRQAITGELGEAEWQEGMKSLLLAVHNGQANAVNDAVDKRAGLWRTEFFADIDGFIDGHLGWNIGAV